MMILMHTILYIRSLQLVTMCLLHWMDYRLRSCFMCYKYCDEKRFK